MSTIRVSSSVPIGRRRVDAIRKLARVPLGQLDVPRRLLFRALRRAGASRDDLERWFPLLTRAQIATEELADGAQQAGVTRAERDPG